MKICATTVMMPEYDMRETAECLSRLGFDGAEWRCRHVPEAARDQAYSPWGNVKNDFSPDNLDTRGEELVCAAKVEAACIDLAGRPRKPPAGMLETLRPYFA